MKHVQIITAAVLYGLISDGTMRETVLNTTCMYLSVLIWWAVSVIKGGKRLTPVLFLFVAYTGYSQKYDEKAVQFFVSDSYVFSLAQKKIDKPIPIHMPYYDKYTDPTLGIQWRYTADNSAMYASMSLQQISLGNRLMTYLPIPIPFSRTNFTRIKIGILAEVLIDWNPNRYKPLLNYDAAEVKTNISYIDNLINKPLEKLKIPAYTENAATYAYGITMEYPMTFDSKYQAIPYAHLKNYGKLDKLNFEIGFRMAFSYEKVVTKIKK
jgi:hypothetical protein